MQKNCKQCASAFEITDDDLQFYDSVSPVFAGKKEAVPPPTLCPECRLQRRLFWRNERNLVRRTCDACSKSIVSIYHDDAPFPVYCNSCWWGDGWNAASFGREMHFTKPISEQLQEMRMDVPRNALYLNNAINSDYCNHSLDLKDCYLCACVGNETQNGYYSKWILGSRDFSDCYQLVDLDATTASNAGTCAISASASRTSNISKMNTGIACNSTMYRITKPLRKHNRNSWSF